MKTAAEPPYGSSEYAALFTEGRHPGVQTALAWLAFSHLPVPLQLFSRPFYQAALELIDGIPNDSAELITALNTLVEAKDWAVRAGIRSDQGKPGPVPRPATVVDPPTDWPQTARDLISGDQERVNRHLPPWREPYPTTPDEAHNDDADEKS